MFEINKYRILEDIGLIIQYHEKSLTYSGMKNLSQEIINDKAFNPDYGFIIDVRRTNLIITEKELHEYGNWMKDNLGLKGCRQVAILTSTPDQVAKFTLFMLNEHLSGINILIFSTINAAVYFLNIGSQAIESITNEIKKLHE